MSQEDIWSNLALDRIGSSNVLGLGKQGLSHIWFCLVRLGCVWGELVKLGEV